MFLIKCKEDETVCIVEEGDVIAGDNVKTGDNVAFFYNKKKYHGKIIMISGKTSIINMYCPLIAYFFCIY